MLVMRLQHGRLGNKGRVALKGILRLSAERKPILGVNWTHMTAYNARKRYHRDPRHDFCLIWPVFGVTVDVVGDCARKCQMALVRSW